MVPPILNWVQLTLGKNLPGERPCPTLSDLDWSRHLGCLIAMGFDNRTVTFRIDHTPLHRIAVQFEWA